jgi:DUF2917 family protein
MEDMSEELEFAKGDVLLLRHLDSGRVLYGLSGMVWVTQEGDSRDHLLGPGGSFRVLGSGRVVVQGLKRSRVLITSDGRLQELESLKSVLINEVA